MQLTLLRLYSIVNQPLPLTNTKEGWLSLDDEELPSILIFEEELAKKILKSDVLVPIDLLDFFKSASGLNSSDLPSLSHFLIKTPLILNGVNHFQAKASLMPIFKLIEKDENKWADTFVSHFFMEHNDKKINPVSFAENFVRSFFKEIISRQDVLCYFTDVVKKYEVKDTKHFSDASAKENFWLYSEKDIENFTFLNDEINLLNPDIIIGLGNESYTFLKKHFGLTYKIEKVTHPNAWQDKKTGENAWDKAIKQINQILS